MTTRRVFLKTGGLALAGFGLAGALPGVLQSMAQAAPPAARGVSTRPRTLVVLFQRGAVDGLNLLVPHADSAYYDARRSIAVPRPGQANGALDLDGRFGLHPALAPLLPFWKAQRMTAVHAAGSPDNTRSHFDAQDYMESGTPGLKSTRDGWLNRLLQAQAGASPFAAVAMTAQTPRMLAGRAPTIAMTSLERFAVQAGAYTAPIEGGFEQMWQGQDAGALGEAGHETFEAVQFLQKSNAARRRPDNGAAYPPGELGNSLRQLAQLIKADVGLRLGFAEAGGWDTHVNQGGATGQLANRLREFGQGIAAFLTDLGPQRDEVLLVTMSEFGRTVRENGSRGTDHGHGNAMLLFGNGVDGGKVHGRWPGLASSQLYEGRDLAVATDFRTVLGEVAHRHLRATNLQALFPGFADDRASFVGAVRA
ncbi:MAG: DUF1501 domain-containing protein [Arenimonas sp.]